MCHDKLHLSIGCQFDLHHMDKILTSAEVEVSFYGAPPKFSLDGGRLVDGGQYQFDAAIPALGARNVPLYLCCNSVASPDEVCIDEATWQMIEAVYAPGNGVIVARHWIAEEIRQRFPGFRFIFSSIGALTETWDEAYLFNAYDVVVCPVNRTNDFSLVKDPLNWSKLEVFLNNECINFGPHCLGHYRYNSLVNSGKILRATFQCPSIVKDSIAIGSIQPSYPDLLHYIQLGVRRFKVIERTAENQDFEVYIKCMQALAAETGSN